MMLAFVALFDCWTTHYPAFGQCFWHNMSQTWYKKRQQTMIERKRKFGAQAHALFQN